MSKLSLVAALEGKRIPVVLLSTVIHTCRNCGWSRSLVDDEKERRRVYFHRIHDWVTVEEAAKLDIETHDCNQTEHAKARLAEYIRSHDV